MGTVTEVHLQLYRRYLTELTSRQDRTDILEDFLLNRNFLVALPAKEVDAEVVDFTINLLYHLKFPYDLAAALTNAVLERIRAEDKSGLLSDRRPISYDHQNGSDDHSDVIDTQDYDSNKLFDHIFQTIFKICEDWVAKDDWLNTICERRMAEDMIVSSWAIKGNRRKMEDRHVITPNLNLLYGLNCDSPAAFFAILDGHGGVRAAEFTASRILDQIVNHPSFPDDIERAIKEAHLSVDAMFVQKFRNEARGTGTTALSCLIYGSKLYTAWLGDSQAILVRNGLPLLIMNPHKPNRPDENKRITDLGGQVVKYGTWRVNGTLAVSRAIGDSECKPYVCADADVQVNTLDGKDDFLVLACDGLWDVLKPAQVTVLVYEYLLTNKTETDDTAARLVMVAKERNSQDNITAIVVFLRPILDLIKEAEAALNSSVLHDILATESRSPSLHYDDYDHLSSPDAPFHPDTVIEESPDLFLNPDYAMNGQSAEGVTDNGGHEYYSVELQKQTDCDFVQTTSDDIAAGDARSDDSRKSMPMTLFNLNSRIYEDSEPRDDTVQREDTAQSVVGGCDLEGGVEQVRKDEEEQQHVDSDHLYSEEQGGAEVDFVQVVQETDYVESAVDFGYETQEHGLVIGEQEDGLFENELNLAHSPASHMDQPLQPSPSSPLLNPEAVEFTPDMADFGHVDVHVASEFGQVASDFGHVASELDHAPTEFNLAATEFNPSTIDEFNLNAPEFNPNAPEFNPGSIPTAIEFQTDYLPVQEADFIQDHGDEVNQDGVTEPLLHLDINEREYCQPEGDGGEPESNNPFLVESPVSHQEATLLASNPFANPLPDLRSPGDFLEHMAIPEEGEKPEGTFEVEQNEQQIMAVKEVVVVEHITQDFDVERDFSIGSPIFHSSAFSDIQQSAEGASNIVPAGFKMATTPMGDFPPVEQVETETEVQVNTPDAVQTVDQSFMDLPLPSDSEMNRAFLESTADNRGSPNEVDASTAESSYTINDDSVFYSNIAVADSQSQPLLSLSPEAPDAEVDHGQEVEPTQNPDLIADLPAPLSDTVIPIVAPSRRPATNTASSRKPPTKSPITKSPPKQVASKLTPNATAKSASTPGSKTTPRLTPVAAKTTTSVLAKKPVASSVTTVKPTAASKINGTTKPVVAAPRPGPVKAPLANVPLKTESRPVSAAVKPPVSKPATTVAARKFVSTRPASATAAAPKAAPATRPAAAAAKPAPAVAKATMLRPASSVANATRKPAVTAAPKPAAPKVGVVKRPAIGATSQVNGVGPKSAVLLKPKVTSSLAATKTPLTKAGSPVKKSVTKPVNKAAATAPVTNGDAAVNSDAIDSAPKLNGDDLGGALPIANGVNGDTSPAQPESY